MLANNSKEEGKCRELKVEKNDDLRTIDCLRGRLLAERQASKVANQDAEIMSNKLTELEKQLKEEIKLREKAEKKLKLLKKKLQSLKLSPTLDHHESEKLSSTSSDNCFTTTHSLRSSSSTTTSGSDYTEESGQSKPQITTAGEDSQYPDYGAQKDVAAADRTHESASSSTDSAPCHVKDGKDPTAENSSTVSEDSKINDNNSTISRMKDSIGENGSDKEEDEVENSLAMVPVTVAVKSERKEVNVKSGSVKEVLDALKHAREKIQTSMETTRHMIRVGPS